MSQSETSIRGKIVNGVVVMGDSVLIFPDEAAEYYGMIEAPKDNKLSFPTTGTIMKLGLGLYDPKKNEYFTPLHVGDRVVYSKYAGIECKFEDKTAICLKAADVLLIVDVDKQKGE